MEINAAKRLKASVATATQKVNQILIDDQVEHKILRTNLRPFGCLVVRDCLAAVSALRDKGFSQILVDQDRYILAKDRITVTIHKGRLSSGEGKGLYSLDITENRL